MATTEEVALLHSQFEAEFARQAAKAAEAAKQAPNAAAGAGALTLVMGRLISTRVNFLLQIISFVTL